MATCRLCLKKKQLLKKSRIIPEFMYKSLFNEKHRLYVFNKEDLLHEGRHKTIPTGEYQGGILCKECDNIVLGYYESYVNRILYVGQNSDKNLLGLFPRITPNGVRLTEVFNIDYLKFKLFLLSLLWRASICKRPFFSDVKLGCHEEKIRKMLLDGYPGEIKDYPMIAMTYACSKKIGKDAISTPRKFDNEHGQGYVFVITGMLYFIFISAKQREFSKLILDSTLKPDNTLRIIHMPENSENQVYRLMGL